MENMFDLFQQQRQVIIDIVKKKVKERFVWAVLS